MAQEPIVEKAKVNHKTQTEILQKELTATQNSALVRLAFALERQGDRDVVNYSRMHHRHNRS